MRRIAALAALLVTALVTILSGSASAAAGESDFVSRANSARDAAGRSAYAVRADLVAVARRHAARMAARQSIWHNPNLGSEVDNWVNVGENVGMGDTVEVIHDAFMNSPTHRANILDRDFREIGVGTAMGADGKIYVAQVFRNPVPAAATTTAAAPTRSRPVLRTASAAPARPAVVRPAPRTTNVHTAIHRVVSAARLADVLAERAAAAAAVEGSVPQALAFAKTLSALNA